MWFCFEDHSIFDSTIFEKVFKSHKPLLQLSSPKCCTITQQLSPLLSQQQHCLVVLLYQTLGLLLFFSSSSSLSGLSDSIYPTNNNKTNNHRVITPSNFWSPPSKEDRPSVNTVTPITALKPTTIAIAVAIKNTADQQEQEKKEEKCTKKKKKK